MIFSPNKTIISIDLKGMIASGSRAPLNMDNLNGLFSKVMKMKFDALSIIINSPGGDVSEMFGIIDFMEIIDTKVNTICRGSAQSAGAIILACGTGQRAASKHSTIMFHQGSTFSQGKLSDVRAGLEYSKSVEAKIYALLGDKTKKPAEWWEEKMKSDFYLTAEDALELGVIDTIG